VIKLQEYIHGDKRKLDAELAELIRSDNYEQLEKILQTHLCSSDGELARIALSLGIDDVKFEAWDRIFRTHTVQGRNPQKITAVGLDLDLYAGEQKPVFLANYYADFVPPPDAKGNPNLYSFSGRDRAEILAACATYPAPWLGDFDEIDTGPEIVGLDLLYHALEETPGRAGQRKPESEEAALDRYAARWWLMLRLHQAVHRDLAKVAMPHRVPIIVGAHGWPEWCCSVHYPTRIGSSGDIGDTLPPLSPTLHRQKQKSSDDPPAGKGTGGSDWGTIFEGTGREAGDRLYNEIDRLATQARQMAEDVTKRFDADDLKEIKRAADIVGSVLKKWVGR
jgi:hypothetical protein